MEYFLQKFAEYGGVFGILFGGSLIVIFFLFKENRTLQREKLEQVEKRVEELKVSKSENATAAEASRQIAENGFRVAENTFEVVKNLQQLLNIKGGRQQA
jgi:predicted acyltransferase (DUF342 family)